MPRLLLIRHGSHDLLGRELVGRRPGVRLNKNGRREAEALARRLSPLTIAALYASPRERAVETAEPIGRLHGLAVETEPALDEVDFGDWTGRMLDRLDEEPLWRRFNRDRALTRIPGGETMAEVAARMSRLFGALTARHPDTGTAIALVGHGDPLRAADCARHRAAAGFHAEVRNCPRIAHHPKDERARCLERLQNDCGHCEQAC